MRLSAVLGFSALVSTFLLTGCSSFQTTASSSLAQGAAVQGRVHGGRQAIVGARVFLMAANTNGYGGASVSLLDGNATGQSDSIGAYVLTDAQGGFSISGDYSCTATQQVYLLAVGGDAGAGNNSASALMAVLGQCPAGSTNFGTAVPFISVNEVTTVAGVYALSGYMTDMLHVSSSGTALANIGMANAFVTAANLANISSGSANATTPAGNGTVPQAKINTLANILAACINSDGTVVSTPAPTNCYTLFFDAASDGTPSGLRPTETVTAALYIAHNPGTNVPSLFGLQPGAAPFQPSLSSVTDFTIALNFTGGGVFQPISIAVDGYGDIWTSNYPNSQSGASSGNSVSKFAAGTGAAVSPGTGYTGGGIADPNAIAIDNLNNVWIGDSSINGSTGDIFLSKLAQDGTPITPTGYDLGIAGNIFGIGIDSHGNAIVTPPGTAWKVDGATGVVTRLPDNLSIGSFGIAVEPDDTIWMSNLNPSPGVLELDTSGAVIFPSSGGQVYNGPLSGLYGPAAVAIDHSGNVWVANGVTIGSTPSYGVAEFSNTGTLLSPTAIFGNKAGYDNEPWEPRGLSIDGIGNVFIATNPNFLVELNNSGRMISPFGTPYTDSSLNAPSGVAVDGSGNVWLSNYSGNSLTEFVGAAAPVVTPIAAGVANNTLGTQP